MFINIQIDIHDSVCKNNMMLNLIDINDVIGHASSQATIIFDVEVYRTPGVMKI